jgi:Leucine Rich repeat
LNWPPGALNACMPQVETLRLGWCKIGEKEGAKAVADLVMFNTTLAVLDLRGNGLGNNGAILVSRGLKEHVNEKLTELDLGYNEMKDDGAFAIAQVRAQRGRRACRGCCVFLFWGGGPLAGMQGLGLVRCPPCLVVVPQRAAPSRRSALAPFPVPCPSFLSLGKGCCLWSSSRLWGRGG